MTNHSVLAEPSGKAKKNAFELIFQLHLSNLIPHSSISFGNRVILFGGGGSGVKFSSSGHMSIVRQTVHD